MRWHSRQPAPRARSLLAEVGLDDRAGDLPPADDPLALDRARYETFAAFLVNRGLIEQAPALDTYLRDMR